MFSWAGPNGFMSASQNPTLTNVQSVNAGLYTVTFTSPAGCTAMASANVTVNETPTITLGPNPSVCQATSPAILTYSATILSPV